MSRNLARFLAGIVAVAVIWIATYWWLNPRPSDKISFGAATPVSAKSPPAQPRKSVEIVDLKRPPLKATQPAKDSTPATTPIKQGSEAPPLLSPARVQAPEGGPHPEPRPAPESAKPSSTPAVIAPRFVDYTIRRGDTLESIATSRLGSAKHVEAIRRSNPLKDLDKLKIGDVIHIPTDPTNIQGKPAPGSPPPTPPSERQGEMLEYTVQNGETLSKIAKDKYGSTSYQDLIYQANRDRLSSPNALKEGQKLRLPKKPAG